MTYFRGLDASLTENGTAVAQLTDIDLTVTLAELKTDTLGAVWSAVVGGLASWSMTAKMMIDLTTSTGQAILVNQLVVANPVITANSAVVFQITNTTKKFSGNCLIKSCSVAAQVSNIVTMSVAMTGSGALAVVWS